MSNDSLCLPLLRSLRKEYFADYAPLLPCLFSLNHTPTKTAPLYGSNPNTWDPKALTRSTEGIAAVLLSLRKKPVIRYEKMSGMARKLAVEVQVSCSPCCGIMLNHEDTIPFSIEYSQSLVYSNFDLHKLLPCC